jgi:ligand-binding sensor domain-containing protein
VPASTQGLQLISSEDTGLPFDWRSEVIKAVAYDSQANVLWIGSLHHLAWFDHNTNQWHESPLPANFGLEALAVDKDSSLWMGGAQGLAVTEPKASASITPVVDEHMLATEVRALAVDGDGYLWIGYYRREAVYGLNAYNPHAPSDWLTLVDQNNPAFSMVNSLTIGEDDIVWAATDAGLLRLDSAGVRTAYTAAEGFAGNRVPSDDIRVVVPLEDGQVWISTFGGNIILDDGASADKSDDAWLESDPTQLGLAAIPLTAFATDPEGAIWLGTHHGLWRWFEGGGCQIDFASGLAVTAMALDTGATATPRRWLWVGTENGGLYVWKFE